MKADTPQAGFVSLYNAIVPGNLLLPSRRRLFVIHFYVMGLIIYYFWVFTGFAMLR